MRHAWHSAFLAFGAVLLVSGTAMAHVELSEVGFAGERQVLDFTVGHGCEGADTVGLEIRLPPEITSVRAVPWAYGDAQVMRDDADIPIAVIWTKATPAATDDQFYAVQLRITVPDMPFERLTFPAVQTCRSADGAETVVEWVGMPGADEPAPELLILPARYPGWNRITVPTAIDDLTIFDDAEIVWQGDAAYSGNPAIAALIESDPTVEVLTQLVPGSDVWIRY